VPASSHTYVHLDRLAILPLGMYARDPPRGGPSAGVCRSIALLTLDNKAVLYKVGEYVVVHAM
jgi:hypothetical protein